jgi:hypothetical protein
MKTFLETPSFQRRDVLKMALAVSAGFGGLTNLALAADFPAIIAYRDPGCGCCEQWAAHMTNSGFQVSIRDDLELEKRRVAAGVPVDIASCHTAVMGNYVLEGHVPAADVIRLLAEKPDVLGLAVAGMPMGSPGMETDGTADAYDVYAFKADGTWSVFSSYGAS